MNAAGREEVRILLGIAAGLWVICIGPAAWFLRDWLILGPEWRPSGGLTAVLRFLSTCWFGPVLGVLLALFAALSINRTEPRP